MLLLVPMILLGDAPYLRTVPHAPLEVASMAAMRLHEYGFGVGVVFFGLACLLEGRLIRRSGFLPYWIGVLMQVGGMGYLANMAAMFAAPKLQPVLFPALMLPVFVAELSLALRLAWGVDEARWRAWLPVN